LLLLLLVVASLLWPTGVEGLQCCSGAGGTLQHDVLPTNGGRALLCCKLLACGCAVHENNLYLKIN
jgi:hypothetical protein